VHRVVLEEVRERLGIREVVDGNDFDIRNLLLLRRAEDLPPDAPEAVDSYTNGHPDSPFP
jgi:hypothetical protein